MAKPLTKEKARTILHDKSVRGHPLTEKQRRFFGARASGQPRNEKNVPLFLGNLEPEVKQQGVPWWEEPTLGPADQQSHKGGVLINQGALFMNQGTSGPPLKGDEADPFPVKIQEQPLTDADFHNKQGRDIRKGTDMHLEVWQRGAGPKELA